MTTRREKRTTTQPHKALRTRTCAAHHERGEELVPGDAAWGVVGAKGGARPLPAYDGSSHTTTARKGEHERGRDCAVTRSRVGNRHSACIRRAHAAPRLPDARNAETRRRAQKPNVFDSHSTSPRAGTTNTCCMRETGKRTASRLWTTEALTANPALRMRHPLPSGRGDRHPLGQVGQFQRVIGGLRYFPLFPARDTALGDTALLRNLGLSHSSLAKGLDVFGGFAHARIMHICVIKQRLFALFNGA